MWFAHSFAGAEPPCLRHGLRARTPTIPQKGQHVQSAMSVPKASICTMMLAIDNTATCVWACDGGRPWSAWASTKRHGPRCTNRLSVRRNRVSARGVTDMQRIGKGPGNCWKQSTWTCRPQKSARHGWGTGVHAMFHGRGPGQSRDKDLGRGG
jgi:hypothetical protein